MNHRSTSVTGRFRRARAATLLLLVPALLLAACGGSDDEPSSQPSSEPSETTQVSADELDSNATLRVLTTAVPTELDPHRETTSGTRSYWFQVFDRLTRLDQQLQPHPMLATDWETSEDGLTLTMTLRDDVTFHDGTPFNADAVVASIERGKTLEGSKVVNDLSGVDAVTAVSDTEVQFTLNRPMPDLPSILAGPAGAMISPKAIADPTIDLMTDPKDAGSGPYLVKEFVPSESVSYVRAPGENWDEEAGKLAEIEIVRSTDDRARFSALQAGQADAIFIQPVFGDQVAEAIQLGEGDDFDHVAVPNAALTALLFRQDVPPMDNPDLRKAIISAIDRDAIADGYLRGTCPRSDQIAPAGYDGHIEDFEDPYPYDLDAATQYLADAGFADGLDLDVYVHAGREQMPEIFKEQLSQIGIDVTVKPLAAVEVYTTWVNDEAPTWFYQLTPQSHFLATVRNGVFGPSGVGGSPSAEVADLLEQAAAASGDEADELYKAIAQQLADEALVVPFCHPDAHYVVASDVVNFESAPMAYLNATIDLRYVGRKA